MLLLGNCCSCCYSGGDGAKRELSSGFLTNSVNSRTWAPATRYNVDVTHEGVTPLVLAIRACNINQAKMLLAAGANPLAVCSVASGGGSSSGGRAGDGWSTPLHAAGKRSSHG
jgi:hypothetical protein